MENQSPFPYLTQFSFNQTVIIFPKLPVTTTKLRKNKRAQVEILGSKQSKSKKKLYRQDPYLHLQFTWKKKWRAEIAKEE